MKIIIGPSVNEVQILNDKGENIVPELCLTEVVVRTTANGIPTAELTCQIFGQVHELEVKTENVKAWLIQNGIEQIETLHHETSEKEPTLADFHPNT